MSSYALTPPNSQSQWSNSPQLQPVPAPGAGVTGHLWTFCRRRALRRRALRRRRHHRVLSSRRPAVTGGCCRSRRVSRSGERSLSGADSAVSRASTPHRASPSRVGPPLNRAERGWYKTPRWTGTVRGSESGRSGRIMWYEKGRCRGTRGWSWRPRDDYLVMFEMGRSRNPFLTGWALADPKIDLNPLAF